MTIKALDPSNEKNYISMAPSKIIFIDTGIKPTDKAGFYILFRVSGAFSIKITGASFKKAWVDGIPVKSPEITATKPANVVLFFQSIPESIGFEIKNGAFLPLPFSGSEKDVFSLILAPVNKKGNP